MSKVYGVYMHCKPDGLPFYIGKGTDKRSRDFFTGRNSRHKRTVAKYGRENILVRFMQCESESSALEMEKGLIKTFRVCGFDLANYTDGGDGVSGIKHTEETRKRMSITRKGRLHTEKQKSLISARLTGVKKAPFSAEHKRKLGAIAKGKRWYNNGQNIAFCLEGQQPEGYVLGRLRNTLTKEKKIV